MKTKIKIYKDWYYEIILQMKFLERKGKLTLEEEMKYDNLIDQLEYIYRINGYT